MFRIKFSRELKYENIFLVKKNRFEPTAVNWDYTKKKNEKK